MIKTKNQIILFYLDNFFFYNQFHIHFYLPIILLNLSIHGIHTCIIQHYLNMKNLLLDPNDQILF